MVIDKARKKIRYCTSKALLRTFCLHLIFRKSNFYNEITKYQQKINVAEQVLLSDFHAPK